MRELQDGTNVHTDLALPGTGGFFILFSLRSLRLYGELSLGLSCCLGLGSLAHVEVIGKNGASSFPQLQQVFA